MSATSKYIGVSKSKVSWWARINAKGRHIHIGSFKTEKEAALAYNVEALKYFGDKARLNEVVIG